MVVHFNLYADYAHDDPHGHPSNAKIRGFERVQGCQVPGTAAPEAAFRRASGISGPG